MLTKNTNKIVNHIDFSDLILREHAVMIMKAFKKSMVEKGTSKIDIQVERRRCSGENYRANLQVKPHCRCEED